MVRPLLRGVPTRIKEKFYHQLKRTPTWDERSEHSGGPRAA